jgi:hypothetical protein
MPIPYDHPSCARRSRTPPDRDDGRRRLPAGLEDLYEGRIQGSPWTRRRPRLRARHPSTSCPTHS